MRKEINAVMVMAIVVILAMSGMLAGCGQSESVQNETLEEIAAKYGQSESTQDETSEEIAAKYGWSESIQDETSEEIAGPNILKISDKYGVYYYLVDLNTGVVYLAYNGYQRFGMTVCVNADGTPVTADQLGIATP